MSQTSKAVVALQRSRSTLWHDLSELEQQSLLGGVSTGGDVDRPVIVGPIIRSSEGLTGIDTMVHELGHAHGRQREQPVIISWAVDFNA